MMRYARVQTILESDRALRRRLSPRICEIKTWRHGSAFFSKEVVEITDALQQEGKDPHRLPQNEVLSASMRHLRSLGFFTAECGQAALSIYSKNTL